MKMDQALALVLLVVLVYSVAACMRAGAMRSEPAASARREALDEPPDAPEVPEIWPIIFGPSCPKGVHMKGAEPQVALGRRAP